MTDEQDKALEIDILANMLRAEQSEASDLVEMLAGILDSALPDRTSIKRGGWFMSRQRPVVELNVQFDEIGFLITRSKHGTVMVKEQKIVRGISLKSSDISMDECINKLVAQLSDLSQKNAQTRDTLQKFIEGR